MKGINVLPACRGIVGNDVGDMVRSLEAVGARIVESVADGPDIVLASTLTKKLEKELAAADLQPQLLDDDTVNDWFLPSNEELVGLLSAANVDL